MRATGGPPSRAISLRRSTFGWGQGGGDDNGPSAASFEVASVAVVLDEGHVVGASLVQGPSRRNDLIGVAREPAPEPGSQLLDGDAHVRGPFFRERSVPQPRGAVGEAGGTGNRGDSKTEWRGGQYQLGAPGACGGASCSEEGGREKGPLSRKRKRGWRREGERASACHFPVFRLRLSGAPPTPPSPPRRLPTPAPPQVSPG